MAQLFGAGPRESYASGAAPALLRAFERPVASAIVAERSPVYVTVLYGLLLLRRDHELEPLHDDVERFVATAALAVDPAWDEPALARDLDQLESWGCVERRAEPLRIRGYKDVRRERFRYRLTDDAVALLEWLEARLQARLEGHAVDSRDLMIDVLGAVKELTRVVQRWQKGDRDDESPRRALHLLGSIDEHAHVIGEELLAFRASMMAFASRAYDLDVLRTILTWLERYVGVYVARIETLRAEVTARLDDLAIPRFRRALGELHERASRERAEAPAAFRTVGVLRDPSETLDGLRSFFAERGRLIALCARIDESARAVLRKMHWHLRELERRSARLQDLRTRVLEIAALAPADIDPRLARFENALVGSAHARFGTRHVETGSRLAPPLPRRHSTTAQPAVVRPLRSKRAPPEEARALRARRLSELRAWIEHEILRGEREVRLSVAAPAADDSARRWLDVARARHLDRARDLERLGVAIDDTSGTVSLGTPTRGLQAPDCHVRALSAAARRSQ